MDSLTNQYVDVQLEKELNAFSVKFLGFVTLDQFKEIVDFEFDLVSRHQLKKCIIDLRQIPTYDIGMPEHVKEVWFPTASKLGLKHVAFIVPEAVLGKMSMKRAHDDGEVIAGMNVAHFDNFDDGLNWLKNR